MKLPVPLCFWRMCGSSLVTKDGTRVSWEGGFVGAASDADVPTAFFMPEDKLPEGRPLPNQQGLVAAHLDAQLGIPMRLTGGDCYYNYLPDYCYLIRLTAKSYRHRQSMTIPFGFERAGTQYCGSASLGVWVTTKTQKDEIEYKVDSVVLDHIYAYIEPSKTIDDWTEKWVQNKHLTVYAHRKVCNSEALVAPVSYTTRVKRGEPVSFSLVPYVDIIPDTVYNAVFDLDFETKTHGPAIARTDFPIPDYSSSINSLLHETLFDDWSLMLHRRARCSGTYEFEWLVQHAYVEALEAIPRASSNSIANVQAALEGLASLSRGEIPLLPAFLKRDFQSWKHVAADSWLQYRYEYSTTAMDLDEYGEFFRYIIDRYGRKNLASRAHGRAVYGDVECRCSLSWAEKGLSGLSNFMLAFWQSGLEPNAYVLWDSIPYSFVADWFVPVGDVLEVRNTQRFRNEEYFQISDVVFSLRYNTGPVEGMRASHYVRWTSDPLSELDESYWFDQGTGSISGATLTKRILDAGSLLTSRF